MPEYSSKKVELFYLAFGDIWGAEQTWRGNPNLAMYLCQLATEKTMKGFLRCLNKSYEFSHDLNALLNVLYPTLIKLDSETIKYIQYLDRWGSRLRYKSMPSDPTKEDSEIAIIRTKKIMQEFAGNSHVSKFMSEADEIWNKTLNTIREEDKKEIDALKAELEKERAKSKKT